jgi:DNA repair protein RecO (recombination protein O)
MDWISTEAIVLRARDTGSLDRMVTLITPSHGRTVCVAKSARRSLRRFGGCLGTFSRIEAEISIREGRDMGRLESCTLLDANEGIRECLDRLQLASAGAEIVDRITHTGGEFGELFGETAAFLKSVSTGGGIHALVRFEIRALSMSGFRPELGRCVCCGREASERSLRRIFDVHRGGLICPSCSRSGGPGYLLDISGGARDELVAMLEGGTDTAAPGAVLAECTTIMNALVTERLGAPLRSWL